MSMNAIDFTTIAKRLKALQFPDFDVVVGIAEGGIVPASLVANKLQCDLAVLKSEYRDADNKPVFPDPVIRSGPRLSPGYKKLLLVDDVSVSGKTLKAAKSVLTGYKVKTFVLKGKADFVLFPELNSCVKWPWYVNGHSGDKE